MSTAAIVMAETEPVANDDKTYRHDQDVEKGALVGSGPEIETGLETEVTTLPVLQDQTNLLPTKQVLVIFLGLTCATFCSLLDQTIVSTALPTIGKDFNASEIESWVGSAYFLASTTVQPIYGRMSDIFGRKPTLLFAISFFMVGSLACALAKSMVQLIIFRALQGIGGGGILVMTMIIVTDIVSLKERGKYQGVTGAVVACAASLGPIIGGVFTESVSWRWCFWINLPISSVALLLVMFLLPFKKVTGKAAVKFRQIDYAGFVLTIAWVTPTLLALSWAGSLYAWSSAAVVAPLVIGLFLLAVFLIVEIKLVALPLIPFHIFRIKSVAANMATTFVGGVNFYSTLYYLPQFLQIVRGYSPTRAGILVLPLALVSTMCTLTCGIVMSRTGDYKWNLIIGYSVWCIGLGLFSTVNEHTPLARMVGFEILMGLGAGQTFQTSLVAIQAAVKREEAATATGCRTFIRMVGGTIALAVCAALVNNIVRAKLSSFDPNVLDSILTQPTQLEGVAEADQVRAAFAKAINACFLYLMCPLAGVSAVVTVVFVDRVPLVREDDEQRKAEAKRWLEQRR